MITCEVDPDVVRWGLNQLCSLSSSGSRNAVTQYDVDISRVENIREGYCDSPLNNVENDELIARAFQEELSRIADAEASGSSNGGEGHFKASILAQDWTGPSKNQSSPAHEKKQQADNEMVKDALCSKEKLKGGESSNVLELKDESDYDAEVEKRLTRMVPIPHVPKINGEIPSVDEATSDHQRLLDRLQLYDLVELKVQGDGNCQFRALSDQFYGSTDHHKFVRNQIVDQLKLHPEMYEGYVPMSYSDYVKKMSKNGEWGDHVTLQAAADSYGIRIFVLTSFKDTCYIEILPQIQKSERIIFMSFWAEVHYNSIYPTDDMPSLETKEKKKWWLDIFG